MGPFKKSTRDARTVVDPQRRATRVSHFSFLGRHARSWKLDFKVLRGMTALSAADFVVFDSALSEIFARETYPYICV